MHITNIGGSLTTAVCLSLIAWSIRVLRAQKLAEQKSRENKGGARGDGSLPSIRGGRRAYARLSPTAFWLLVESRSVRPVLVDVREHPEEPDAPELEISRRFNVAHVPVDELARTLRNRHNGAWMARTGCEPPSKWSTIVFISTHGHSASQAASIAVKLGFQRCAVIEGGLAAAAPLAPASSPATPTGGDSRIDSPMDFDGKTSPTTPLSPAARGLAQSGRAASPETHGTIASDVGTVVSSKSPSSPRFPASRVPDGETITRDALALLGEYGAAQGAPLVTVIDVRRHDERSLYGSIRGSVHLPAEHVPRALLYGPEEWLRSFHFRKPSADEVIVVYSRRHERAAYAKQVFEDAGMHRVLVLADGVCGWRNGGGEDEDVGGYDAYAEGEAPPEPYPPPPYRDIDRQTAEAELMHKNVLLP